MENYNIFGIIGGFCWGIFLIREQGKKKLELLQKRDKYSKIPVYAPHEIEENFSELKNKKIFVEGIVQCDYPLILKKKSAEKPQIELVAKCKIIELFWKDSLMDYILKAGTKLEIDETIIKQQIVPFRLEDYNIEKYKDNYINIETKHIKSFHFNQFNESLDLNFINYKKKYYKRIFFQLYKPKGRNIKYLGIKNGSYLTALGRSFKENGKLIFHPKFLVRSKNYLLNSLDKSINKCQRINDFLTSLVAIGLTMILYYIVLNRINIRFN